MTPVGATFCPKNAYGMWFLKHYSNFYLIRKIETNWYFFKLLAFSHPNRPKICSHAIFFKYIIPSLCWLKFQLMYVANSCISNDYLNILLINFELNVSVHFWKKITKNCLKNYILVHRAKNSPTLSRNINQS